MVLFAVLLFCPESIATPLPILLLLLLLPLRLLPFLLLPSLLLLLLAATVARLLACPLLRLAPPPSSSG